MVRYVISLCLLLFTFAAQAAINTGSVPAVSLGGNTASGTMLQGPPTITTPTASKYYSAICGFGTSNVTSGNYYRCRKMAGTNAADWTVSSTKTANCPGFYVQTNNLAGTGNVAFTIGYATGTVTENTGTDPTGTNVPYFPNGSGSISGGGPANYGQNIWHPFPVSFSGTDQGAAIKPWIKSAISSVILVVTWVCTDE